MFNISKNICTFALWLKSRPKTGIKVIKTIIIADMERKISDRIRYVGVNDHHKVIFEGMWPLPFGVSYNSYLVIDEKIALIDTAEADFCKEYLDNVREQAGGRKIDYLIVNHMEPDHSSLMENIREAYPDIRIVTNAKAVPMIKGYYGITDNIHVVKEGDTLSLGNSTLTFYMAPMVHWPETMVTYLSEEKTLFSGDAFGTFGAIDGNPTDSEAHLCGWLDKSADCFAEFKDEMTRYYSNIVGKYGQTVQAALKKLSGLEISRICSTHGPVWEKHVTDVVSYYDKLSKYEADKGVCIVYASMYGNTAKAAKALAAALAERGVKYALHNLSTENVSYAYRDLFKYDTLAVGAPTYNNDIFPPVYNFMYGVGARLVKNRRFFAFGSFTWAGASVRLLNEMATKQGFSLISEGISFPQGYTAEKCDMKAIADLMAE